LSVHAGRAAPGRQASAGQPPPEIREGGMTAGDDYGHAGTLLPRPDPTRLTTEQLLRELANVREIFETRLNGMDKAATVLSETVNRTPTAIQTAISNVREVYDERFASIALQFTERDVRTEQAAKGGKEALDAALLAAKELVAQQNEANRGEAAKTEQNFTKQIDAQAARIDELKERIDRGEGSSSGSAGQAAVRRDTDNQRLIVLGIVISVVVIVVNIVIALVIHH
jgi:hypothetical protein